MDKIVQNEALSGQKELLVVSFGTTCAAARRSCIGAVEAALAAAFPGWAVRRAFTSRMVVQRVAQSEGEAIDTPEQALARALQSGVKTMVVQPTHLMDGHEYQKLTHLLEEYAPRFERLAVGAPLLNSPDDLTAVAGAVTAAMAPCDDGETAQVLMGHGSDAPANAVYRQFQQTLRQAGGQNYYVGTVEGTPTVQEVLADVQAGPYRRAVLRPLMLVAGDHAQNDMAGAGEDSWRAQFARAGYEVRCQLEGLGQLPAVQQLYVRHAAAALAALQ